MTDYTTVRIQTKLLEGLQVKYPDFSFNEIMDEIASDRNRRSRKIYRDEDVLYAIEQFKGYRKEYPGISVEEIIEMIKEYRENKEKSGQV